MADGTFAALMFIIGLTDMGLNHCGTEAGCLGTAKVTPRFAISAGEVLERRAKPAKEMYLRYDLGRTRGPFGNAMGLSVGAQGELWAGFGTTYTFDFGHSPFFAQLHSMPGLYLDNGGFDLGGPIAFRSGLEVGWENRTGVRFGLSYDHRSNAGIYKDNPGIETIQIRISVPVP